MQTIRILSHGQIDDLSAVFKMKTPFSVYVRPKQTNLDSDVLLNCKCICDDEMSVLPVALNDWTPAMIVEIAPNAISLADYDVYWGAGNPKI